MSSGPGPARGLRTHWCGELRPAHAGQQVALCGWVASRREHGEHLAFVDLRDCTGVVQCVVPGATELRSEYVVRVEGTVRRRPEGTANPRLPTGEVEVGDCQVSVLGPAEPSPIPVGDKGEADELHRLRFRYLDLRRPRVQANLRLRARVNSAIRRAMERNGFVEVETPLLWTPTPEGAREFAVPSRLQPGHFYVLPQSPQIAKQLLMVGGVDRYYQIARCLRDEDLRADRQFEFTQLDMEASFVGPEEIRQFVSEAVLDAAEAAVGERPAEIPTITWEQSMERFGTDKPDLRLGMELVDLSSALAGTQLRALQAPCVMALRWPGQAGLARSRLDALVSRARQLGAGGLVWMRTVTGQAGLDLDSPVSAHLSPTERSSIVAACAAVEGDLILAVAGQRELARRVLGSLRAELGEPDPQARLSFAWVVDFPMFEGLDPEGRPVPAHHPFTMPHPDDLGLLASDPLRVRSQAYDLVLNGWELGSGSIRIHRPDVQEAVFAALGISPEQAESRFGFLLAALRYGAPPHGGFAFGIDRLVAIFAGQDNIREVIAFPKAQSGTDPLTGAPKPLAPEALAELGIRVAAERLPGGAS